MLLKCYESDMSRIWCTVVHHETLEELLTVDLEVGVLVCACV